MSSNAIVTATAVLTASLLSHAAIAQTSSVPLSRAEVKAETRAEEKAGELTPAGEGPEFNDSTKSTKTRAQRKAETLAARKAGTLQPAGPAGSLKVDRQIQAAPSNKTRAQEKAETRAAEKADQLIPAGEGPDAPKE